MKKKIALLLKGINSTVNLHNSEIPLNLGENEYKKLDVDFFRCYSNMKKNLIDPLGDQFDLKIYLSTYKSDSLNKINSILNPEKVILNNLDNHPLQTFINGLEAIVDVDYVIPYRFDALLHKNYNELDIDYSFVNFPWREANHWKTIRGVGDLIFLYPFLFNQKFIISLKSCIKKESVHRIYDEMKNISDVSKFRFITNEMCNIFNNPIGTIDRVKVL